MTVSSVATPLACVSGHAQWLTGWCVRHRRWLAVWLVVASLAVLAGRPGWAPAWLLVGLSPGLLALCWQAISPVGYERYAGGPARRVGWWWFCRRRWAGLADACGLSGHAAVTVRRAGRRVTEHQQVAPRLRRVQVSGSTVALTIRARAGQTLDDLEAAAPRLASTLAAVSYRVRPVTGSGSGCTLVVELVMREALYDPVIATEPEPRAVWERVQLGRTQSGGVWWLQLAGRYTLVAGCSGSGKGSVLWGICCGLAPSVRVDLVRLWGVDLKRGVELAMGSGLFSAHAYTPADALAVLRELMRVIDERGTVMAGATRLHEPAVGDPLHVLVIDELAALTAYADAAIRREAERLLAEILTQGRALGVVVVACVQDPRKDVVGMRGLFTQTIALRLRSAEETLMVLGEGMNRIAPAHRIDPTFPGTAWVVEDNGAADRVRADYWPDPLIRDIATRYATEEHVDLAPPHDLGVDDGDVADALLLGKRASREPRPSRERRRQGDGLRAAEGGAA
jgi:S-DNA-T family DNA segregation ATPase FtsK/SpoIIIE